MARNLHTVTVPVVADIEGPDTRDLISLPTCPCGAGPVERFVTVGTSTFLACGACYHATHTGPEVIHHTRSSHGACDHDATPAERAKCRAARRKGEVYVGDGYGDDEELEDDVTHVGSTKGSKLVHAANADTGATACGKTPKTLVVTPGTSDDVTCTDCLDAV